MMPCSPSTVLKRVVSGKRVVIYVHDQERAAIVMEQLRSLLVSTDVAFCMRNTTRWRDIRIEGGGCLRVVSERQSIRGLGCDVFVQDETAILRECAAPVAAIAGERLYLHD